MTKDEQIRMLRQAAREVLESLPEDMSSFAPSQIRAFQRLCEAEANTGRRTTGPIPSWAKKEGA